jgi:hypothetical protein
MGKEGGVQGSGEAATAAGKEGGMRGSGEAAPRGSERRRGDDEIGWRRTWMEKKIKV